MGDQSFNPHEIMIKGGFIAFYLSNQGIKICAVKCLLCLQKFNFVAMPYSLMLIIQITLYRIEILGLEYTICLICLNRNQRKMDGESQSLQQSNISVSYY